MKAAFWDFDGTLVEPNRKWLVSLKKALNACGCPVSEEEIERGMRSGTRRYGPPQEYPDRAGDFWWDDLLERFHFLYSELGAYQDRYEEIDRIVMDEVVNPDNYVLMDGAIEALKASIALGYDNYVLSNNNPDLDTLVDRLGLGQFFKKVYSSGAIGYEKPRPELFELARKLSGDPELCVMIGDNERTDIAGARAAGFASILVFPQAGEASNANAACPDLSGVCEILSRMAEGLEADQMQG